MNKAYLQGFIMGTMGLDDDACPYAETLLTWRIEREEWLRGWNDSSTHHDTLTDVFKLYEQR